MPRARPITTIAPPSGDADPVALLIVADAATARAVAAVLAGRVDRLALLRRLRDSCALVSWLDGAAELERAITA